MKPLIRTSVATLFFLYLRVCAALAQVPTATINGDLSLPTGQVSQSCVLQITPSHDFIINDLTAGASSRHAVGQITTTYTIADSSNVRLSVVPNLAWSQAPANTFYNVQIQANANGIIQTYTQMWRVPTTTTARVADVIIASP